MDNLVVNTKKKFEMEKFLSQVKIDAGFEIKKVLFVSARSVGSAECTNNAICVNGRIYVNAVVVSDENVIKNIEGEFDFTENQKCGFTMSDLFVEDNVDVDNIMFSGTELSCLVIHKMNVFGVFKYEIPNIEEKEDLALEKSSVNFLKMVSSCSDNFVVTENHDLNLENIEILSKNARVILNEASCSVDKIVVEGKVVVDACYQENGEICNISKEFELKQEVFAENVLPNMIADVNVCVKNVTITPELKNEKIVLVYVIDLYVKGVVFEDVSYEVVNDLFSINHETQVVYDYMETKNLSGLKTGEEIINLQSDVSQILEFEDVVGIGKIDAQVTGVDCNDDEYSADVLVVGDIIYKTTNGYDCLKVSTVAKIQIENIEHKIVDEISVIAKVNSLKVKAGKDLDASFKLEYVVKFKEEFTAKYVKNYENIGEKHNNFYGIKVYVAKKDQTVFDVAKILNVNPQTITKQNQVKDCFEVGQKIYVYSPANLA